MSQHIVICHVELTNLERAVGCVIDSFDMKLARCVSKPALRVRVVGVTILCCGIVSPSQDRFISTVSPAVGRAEVSEVAGLVLLSDSGVAAVSLIYALLGVPHDAIPLISAKLLSAVYMCSGKDRSMK